ncbi:DUF7848 domain-containing protein [Streptomyces sp. NBC_01207]|uniref:DUF7848 domain-containing protein n=1 Tax=Streptomyces sp. NBC_01207 TaxID=2903772 RepID=UPI002E10BF35|nr:hypothetical protein OG457_31310 [Streptomyces sp. NBC_01207]
MTRRLFRFADHRITRHPGTAPTVGARCLSLDCTWQTRPGLTLDEADLACLAHTGSTRHKSFERTFVDTALVERVQ